MNNRHYLSFVLSGIIFFFLLSRATPSNGNPGPEPEYIIKLASITPEGTSWSDIAYQFKRHVEEKSGGRIRVIWYLGAVMGDEPDEVRKIRLGQLQGAAFTNVGLSLIAPETRLLSLPFLFQGYDEIDYLLKKMNPQFSKFFAQQGVVLASWVEVGFNYWFTQKPVSSIDDFRSCRMWAWGGDEISTETNQVLGFQNIPVPLPETLTSLQTGLLNSFYGPFYAILGLQWYTQAKYFIDLPFSYTPAAVVMNKKFMDRLPPDLQDLVLKSWDLYLPLLVKTIRRDNEKVRRGFIAQGIKPLKLDKTVVEMIKQKTSPVYRKFSDNIYPAWLLTETQNALREYRSQE